VSGLPVSGLLPGPVLRPPGLPQWVPRLPVWLMLASRQWVLPLAWLLGPGLLQPASAEPGLAQPVWRLRALPLAQIGCEPWQACGSTPRAWLRR